MLLGVLILLFVLRTTTSCLEATINTSTLVGKYATAMILGNRETGNAFRIPSRFTRNQPDIIINMRSCDGTLSCKVAETGPFALFWNSSEIDDSKALTNVTQARCFRTAKGASRPIPIHFVEDGTFFDGRYYYNPDHDYCLASHDENSMTLRLCPVHTEHSIFLPKCCPMNQVIYRNSTCKKLSSDQPQWKPDLYLTDSDGSHSIFKYSPKNLKMYNEDLSAKCPQIKPQPQPYFFYLSPTGLGTGVKHDVKLAVQKDMPGNVVPLYFNADERRWVLKDHYHYCVDATYLAEGPPRINRSVYYTGNPNDFVMYVCSSDDPYDDNYAHQDGKAWAYAITTAISSAFLLITVFIYLLTLKQHNLHGLTVLMYSIAMFGRYLFACIAYFISIYPNDHITGVTSRGWPCLLISIIGHYFYLSCYLWLTVMNFNFYRIFGKTQVVQRNARRLSTLLSCSIFAWGLPFLLVASFSVIDVVYRDPLTEVPVPGYGEMVCFVARPFRGYYVYAPMGIILGANIPLILLTLGVFWNARMRRKNQLGESFSRMATTSEYSVTFFLKLFVIMGGADLVSFLTWYYHAPIQETAVKPVWVIVLEAANYLTPVLLFVLFCLNQRTRKQLMNIFA